MICNGPKQTIFTSGKFWLLQRVSESDTGRYAIVDARPLREVDCEIPYRLKRGGRWTSKGMWIVRSHVG